MADTHEQDTNEDLVFARTIGKSMIIALPLAFIVISLGVWAATGQSLGRSIVAASMPSVLMGVFGGGFVGTVSALAKTGH